MPRNISPRRTLAPPPLYVPLPDAVGIKDPAVASTLNSVIKQLNAVANYVRQQTTAPQLPPPTGPTAPAVTQGAGSTHVVQFYADASGPNVSLYRVWRAPAGTRNSPTDPGPDSATCVGTVVPSRIEDGALHRHLEREFSVTDMDPANPARFKYWVTSIDDRNIESAFVEASGGPVETVLNGPGDQSPEIKFVPLNKLVNPNFENRRVTTTNVNVPDNSYTISSSTNASPIEITTGVSHGLTIGDVVCVTDHATNTNANGWWEVGTTPSATRFTLRGSIGNGVGGATGGVYRADLCPFPPNPGLDPDLPFSTSPTRVIYRPWYNPNGASTDVQFVSNGTRRTNELILKAPILASEVSTVLGLRTVNLGMHLTLSFYAKRSATVPTNSDVRVRFGSLAGSWSATTFLVPIAANLTTNYRRFAMNIAIPSTTAELSDSILITIGNVKNSGTGTDVTIARAMLNIGDQAAAWTPMPDNGDYLSDTGADFTEPAFSRQPAIYIARNGVTYA